MNNWFNDFSNWFDDWFKFRDGLDTFFSGSSSGESKKDLSVAAIYAIDNYKTFKIKANCRIKKYSHNKTKAKYNILRNLKNSQTSLFYKIGFNTKTPPIRIILKDFDDD
jgi:hypothetical protein